MKRSTKYVIYIILGLAAAIVVNMGIIDTWPPVIIGVMPTGSMNPYIEPGDVFFVDNAASFQDVKTKDVIVYTLDNTRIAHRVVERTDVELITQGDMNPIRDRLPVTEEQYIGVVYDVQEIPLLSELFKILPMHALVSFPNNYLLIGIVVMLGMIQWLFFQKRKHKIQG